MKVQIFRHVSPSDVEIGDVVLWENDIPIEIESITRSKDGIELTGHSRFKPGTRAITLRPKDERLRVVPNSREQTAQLLTRLVDAVNDGISETWTVELVNDLKPLVTRGPAKNASAVKATTAPAPANGESTPAADALVP